MLLAKLTNFADNSNKPITVIRISDIQSVVAVLSRYGVTALHGSFI